MLMYENPRLSLSILVKNSHNNVERVGKGAFLAKCARDWREEGGARRLLYCGLSLPAQVKNR